MSVAAVRRVVCRLAPDRPPTDAELVLALAPKSTDHEAAFGALVERYGPMVLGVCRRILADAHDAEDAFQAVFLVLARKASAIRPPGAVGGWLYGVAVRTARKAKTAAARRRRREMTATTANSDRKVGGGEEVGGELDRAELRAVIDAELAALPEAQRAAVVLCDLHGKTRAEAAAELNRPEGTVAAWLARGRKLLAARLARRGVALRAAGLVAVATPAVVSAELASTACAAVLGRGASPTALALAESVMRNLSSGATKLVAVMVAVGALLAAVATAGAWYSGNDPKPDAPPIPLAAPAPGDDPKPKPAPDRTGFVEHKGYVYSASYAPDGKKFLSVGGGTVTVWDSETRRRLFSSGAEFAAFSEDGKHVFAVVDDKFHTLDAVTGKIVKEAVRGQPKPLRPGRWAAFDATGAGRVEFDGVSHTLTAFPVGGELAPLLDQYASGDITGGDDMVYGRGGAFSPDGKRFAGIHKKLKDGGEQGVLSIWDPLSGVRAGTIHRGHNHVVRAFAWSPDGMEIAVAYSDCVRTYHANEKALAGVMAGEDDKGPFKRMQSIDVSGATAVAWSKDSKMLAIAVQETAGASVDNGTGATSTEVVALPVAVVLFDLTTGKEVRRIEGFPDNLPIVALAIRPDGKQLVTAAGFLPDDGPAANAPQPAKNAPGLRVVPLADAKPEPAVWKETKVLDLTGWLGGSVAFSRDGKMLYVGGTGHVRAYDAATLKQLWEAETGEHFAAIALSSDGLTLAATVKDGVRFLDAPTGKTGDLLEEKGNAPHAVGFFPDAPVLDPNTGQLLVTKRKVIFGTGFGYTAKLWVENSPRERGAPSTITASTVGAEKKPADEYAIPLAVAPDGQWAVTRGPIDRDTGKNALWAWAAGGTAGNKSLDGHKAVVVSAAWSKDGKLIATGDADGVVVTWDAEKFKEKSRLKLGGRVVALALSADGKTVAAATVPLAPAFGQGAYTEEVFVWPSASPLAKLEPISRHQAGGIFTGFASLAFAPDGKTLVSGFANFFHLARLGELVGRVRVFTLAAPAEKPAPAVKPATDVNFSPDGKRYLVVRGDKTEVYDTPTGKRTAVVGAEAARFLDGTTFAGMRPKDIAYFDELGRDESATHPRPKTKHPWSAVAFSPKARYLAALIGDDLRVFETATGTEVGEVKPEPELGFISHAITGFRYSADGKRVIATGPNVGPEPFTAGVVVWNAETRKRTFVFKGAVGDEPRTAAFAPTGDTIAVGFWDRVEVWVIDGDVKKNPVRMFATKDPVTALAFSHDGKTLAIGLRVRSYDRWWADVREAYKGEVSLVEVATGTELRRLGEFKRDAILLDDGKLKEPTPDVLRGHSGVWFDPLVQALAFAPDGKKLLAATALPDFGSSVTPVAKEGEVKLFALNEPDPAPKPAVGRQWTDAAVLTDHGALVNGVAVAPDGGSFAAATDGNVTCWDATTRKVLWTDKRTSMALAYSPDGKHLCAAWPSDVKRLKALTGHWDEWYESNEIVIRFGPMRALAYSPDGKRLAASDGYVTKVQKLAQNGEEGSIGKRPKGAAAVVPAGVAWSADGKRLAVVRHEKTDGKWPVALWEVDAKADAVKLLSGHTEPLTCVAWSKDGKVIASGDEKGTVIAWNAATGKELWKRTFRGRDDTDGRINALALSPADNTVAAAVSLGSGKGPERVVLLDGKTGADVEHLMRGSYAYTSVAWASDGKYLVTGSGALPGQVVTQTEPAVGEVVVWERKP